MYTQHIPFHSMCSQIRDIRFGLNAALSPVQSKDSQRDSLKPVTTCNVPVCDILSYRSNYTIGGSSQLQQLTGFFLRLFFFLYVSNSELLATVAFVVLMTWQKKRCVLQTRCMGDGLGKKCGGERCG